MSNSGGPILRLEGIVKLFAQRRVLDGLDLSLQAGEWLGLIGPNGSGKTTVLNVISRLVNVDAGRVVLDGTDITRIAPHRLARLGVARLFQSPYVGLHLPLVENVSLGQCSSWRSSIDEDVAIAALKAVGFSLDPFAKVSSLDRLSMRLLEIARVLVAHPKLVLLDEPAAGLDPTNRDRLSRAIQALRDSTPAVIVVEHDERFVRGLCTRVLTIQEGHIQYESAGYSTDCVESAHA